MLRTWSKTTEDIFVTRLYSSGVLRYAENDSDMDMSMFWKYTAKGPNALGNQDARRIPIRQRTLHPSMLGYLDIADTSSSDPGRSGSLSPYNDMTSLYFDNSLYENDMHFRLSQLMAQCPISEDAEEVGVKADNVDDYNQALDKLYNSTVGIVKMSGVPNGPMDIIVEKDPREGYRQFNENFLMNNETEDTKK